jgi:hypothetical protein
MGLKRNSGAMEPVREKAGGVQEHTMIVAGLGALGRVC